MTTRVSVASNIQSVIRSTYEVERDLRHEIAKRVGAAMRVLWADVRQYVLDDPHASGDLFRSIRQDMDRKHEEIEFMVYTDPKIAPYATITEFGSGSKQNISWETGSQAAPPDSFPPGYPYKAPDIDNIRAFASYIEEWMVQKGISPKSGSMAGSAFAIAKEITRRGTYAHPFMRPAWFDNELNVKRAARHAVKNATR